MKLLPGATTSQCSACCIVKPLSKFEIRRDRPGFIRRACFKCMDQAKRRRPGFIRIKEARRHATRDANAKRRGASDWQEMCVLRSTEIYQWLRRQGVGAARSRAREKGLPFSLDSQWIIDQARRPAKCAITGLDLVFREPWPGRSPHPQAPSIDRINSRRGYTPDNVRLVCFWANTSKNSMSDKNFRKMIGHAAQALYGVKLKIE